MLSWSEQGPMEVSILSGICCDERNLSNVMRKYLSESGRLARWRLPSISGRRRARWIQHLSIIFFIIFWGPERGADTALAHPVRVRGAAGGAVWVQPELRAGDRVPRGGRPRHQDRARGLQSHREEVSDIHQTGDATTCHCVYFRNTKLVARFDSCVFTANCRPPGSPPISKNTRVKSKYQFCAPGINTVMPL